MSSVYYNEIDPLNCAWIRELQAEGVVSKGVVDERSIEDITPTERTLKYCKMKHFYDRGAL